MFSEVATDDSGANLWMPIVGVLVGIGLGAVMQNLLAIKATKREIRLKAYNDYIGAVSMKSRIEAEGAKVNPNLLGRIDDAKYRTILHGSADVIGKLANFEGMIKADMNERQLSFIELCNTMRKDIGFKSDLDKNIITKAIYG